MALYDCFMYFDEDMLLDIRLNILKDKVDKFVIAEATKTHSGEKKKLNFDINNFSKFKDKIEYMIIDNLPAEVNNFKKDWSASHVRDQFQRNSLQKGYKDCSDDDLIMISDLDEIPNPEKIKEFNEKNKYACFIQKNLHQKMNLLNITVMDWPGTKICKKKYLKSPQWLRNIKTKKPLEISNLDNLRLYQMEVGILMILKIQRIFQKKLKVMPIKNLIPKNLEI